jgi:uncharacterized membrane protein YphA (DoxX/SURF4 family)
MTGYARSAGFPFPGIGGRRAGVWLLAGAASIALGFWADVGSLMIALFLVLAALYVHRFWTIQDEGENAAGPAPELIDERVLGRLPLDVTLNEPRTWQRALASRYSS